jgi:signal transduction histidine kinase
VRNPLAGLRASLQMLDRRMAEPRDHEIVAAMIQRIDSLNDKVEDLLLYARPKPARLQAVAVTTLLREIASSARVATGYTGPAIGIEGGEGSTAYADPDMLRAALLNVTMNACQAAGNGEVDIQITADGRICRILIRDRGPGIAAEVRERVFEPFFTTRAAGTGLGLAIVKRLLELQDGRIALHDRADGGTIAEVTIPSPRPELSST